MCMCSRNGAPGCPTRNKYKVDGLVKQSFTITTTSGRRLHIISYYHKHNLREHSLCRVDDDDRFTNAHGDGWHVAVDKAEYPDPFQPDLRFGRPLPSECDPAASLQDTGKKGVSCVSRSLDATTALPSMAVGSRADRQRIVPPPAHAGAFAGYSTTGGLSALTPPRPALGEWYAATEASPTKRLLLNSSIGLDSEYGPLSRAGGGSQYGFNDLTPTRSLRTPILTDPARFGDIDTSGRTSVRPSRWASSQPTFIDGSAAPDEGAMRPDQSAAGVLLSLSKDDGPRPPPYASGSVRSLA